MTTADMLELGGWLMSCFGLGIASSFLLRAFVKFASVIILKF